MEKTAAAGKKTNVSALKSKRERDADAAASADSDPTLSIELDNLVADAIGDEQVLKELFSVAERAQAQSSAAIQNMTVSEFDANVAGGSFEEKLVAAEQQANLAKYGLTPLNTVEGLIKLRSALVQAYRDNHLVKPEVKVKAFELEQALAVLEAKRDLVVLTEQNRARELSTEASLKAAIAEIKAESTQQIAILTAKLDVNAAGANADLTTVEIEAKRKTAQIDHKLLVRQKRVELFKKTFANMQDMRRTISRGVIRPLLKWAFLILVPLVLVANLVADGPGREGTFILGTVNDAWDAIYEPVRDGVVRVYNDIWGDE